MSRQTKLISDLIRDLSEEENFEIIEIHQKRFAIFNDEKNGDVECNDKLIIDIVMDDEGIAGDDVGYKAFALNDDYHEILMFIKNNMTK